MAGKAKPTSAKGRQAGGYQPPILTEPLGGPIPETPPAAGENQNRRKTKTDPAVAAGIEAWATGAGPLVTALSEAVNGADLTTLAGLSAPTEVVTALADTIGRTLTAAAHTAVEETVADARTQGVTVDPPTPDAAGLANLATVATTLIVAAYIGAATRKALQVGPTAAADAVTEVLAAMGAAASGVVAEQLGTATHAARNLGRRAVYDTHPPVGFVADEADDRSACQPCRDVAGRIYTTYDESLADYPGTAGYRECLGGIRCRGYVRARWT